MRASTRSQPTSKKIKGLLESLQLVTFHRKHNLKKLVISCPQALFFQSRRRRLFPFRKRSLPFLMVDATIYNQVFSHDKCNVFPGLSYSKTKNTFLNSFRKTDVEAEVDCTLKVMERARVTCCCMMYQSVKKDSLASVCT